MKLEARPVPRSGQCRVLHPLNYRSCELRKTIGGLHFGRPLAYPAKPYRSVGTIQVQSSQFYCNRDIKPMVQSPLDPAVASAFEAWMKAEILKLSVDTLKAQAVTCTACGEVLGTYIIDYKGMQMRLGTEQTYAFLKFLLAQNP